MKPSSNLYFITPIVILTMLLFYTFFVLYSKSIRLNNSTKELSDYKFIEARWKDDYNKALFSDGNIIPNITIKDQNDNKFELADIVNTNTLVYRFFEVSCRPCVENDIRILNQLQESIKGGNIIVITDLNTPKKMKVFSIINHSKGGCSIKCVKVRKVIINNFDHGKERIEEKREAITIE